MTLCAFIAGFSGGVFFLAAISEVLWRLYGLPDLVVTLGPPLILGVFILGTFIEVWLLGRWQGDDMREWWARVCAWLTIYALAWLVFFGLTLYGPMLMYSLLHSPWLRSGAVLGWLATAAEAPSRAQSRVESPGRRPLEENPARRRAPGFRRRAARRRLIGRRRPRLRHPAGSLEDRQKTPTGGLERCHSEAHPSEGLERCHRGALPQPATRPRRGLSGTRRARPWRRRGGLLAPRLLERPGDDAGQRILVVQAVCLGLARARVADVEREPLLAEFDVRQPPDPVLPRRVAPKKA